MAPVNYKEACRYEICNLFGRQILVTDWRINRETLGDHMYCYTIRHDDDGRGIPVTLENNVIVNFYGTIITHKPIEFPNKEDLYIELAGEDDKDNDFALNYSGKIISGNRVDDWIKEQVEADPD